MVEILYVKNLRTYFYTEEGIVKAVDDVNFKLRQGKTLGIVGESGCGKSVTALSIMRLIPSPPGKIISGNIFYNNGDLLTKTEEEMRHIRGKEISMIFQDPLTSLNPVLSIADQVAEVIKLHQNVKGKNELEERIVEILTKVGIPEAASRINQYPHQFSGGMRQRVMIAIALSCHPKILLADEPTTNLDVTIQAQVLDLITKLQEDSGTSVIYISHDLGVIAEVADDVAVMYAGKVVEYSGVKIIFRKMMHPYTNALLTCVPRVDKDIKKLPVIPGYVPELIKLPEGCAFHPRCKYKIDVCHKEIPQLIEVEPNHFVSCWRAKGLDF